MKIRVCELFAGVGGFRLGIEQALGEENVEVVYANEWDKYCNIIYEKNFKRNQDSRSITDVSTEEIPDHDLLVGGFPCQSFSIAGKRRGFSDTRGTLFFNIARILKDKQPRLLLLENVKGLLSHDNGSTFKTIIATLDELGYDLQWQVLNSKNFGVPQNRERVFIVGHLRGTSRPKVFPFFGTESEAIKENKSTALDANYWKGVDNHGQRTMIIDNIYGGFKEKPRFYGKVSPTIRTASGGGHIPFVALTEVRSDEAKKIRREMAKKGRDWSPRREKEFVVRTDGIIGTLTSSRNLDTLITDSTRIRKLTPIECERLQGFPDNWTAGVSDTQRYKMMGNAVTVNVIKEIIKRLYKI